MLKYLPAAGAALLGVVLAIGAMRPAVDFVCDRTSCVYGERTFRVAEVREVRFVDGFGKHGTQAESQIILASGREMSIGRDATEAARLTHQELQRFFAPGGPPSFQRKGRVAHWMWLLAAAAWIAAIVLGVKARREPRRYAAPGESRFAWQGVKKKVLLGLGAVAILGGAQLVLLLVASRVQGTLILECTQRCRFQGLECLPGGSSRQTLDEGTYEIEVWAATGSALWVPRSFQITTGETTTFVCQ